MDDMIVECIDEIAAMMWSFQPPPPPHPPAVLSPGTTYLLCRKTCVVAIQIKPPYQYFPIVLFVFQYL